MLNTKINIAVMGSCYSRFAFFSNPYANPGYKDRYVVPLTYFHNSFCSLKNLEPVSYDKNIFAELNLKNQQFVQQDFEKDFYKALEKSNVDFLILDVWQDSQKGYVEFDNKQRVSFTTLLKQTDFLDKQDRSYVIKRPTFDEQFYMNEFENSIIQFSNHIRKIIPQERIIINDFQATDRYVNLKGQVKKFSKQKDYVRKVNEYATEMVAILEKHLPKAHIIRTKNYGFIGDKSHPRSLSINHMESGYYKKFLSDVDGVIMMQLKKELLSR